MNRKNVVELLTSKLQKMENQGFILTPHPQQTQSTVAELRGRTGKTTLAHTPKEKLGANAIKNIETLLMEAYTPMEEISDDLDTDPGTKLTGAKLCSLNQSLAYKLLRARKMQNYSKRRQTKGNIETIQEETKQKQQIVLKESEIWKAIRHPDLHRNTRAFLWMATHDAYMIGTNWLRPSFAPETKNGVNATTVMKLRLWSTSSQNADPQAKSRYGNL
jgi:hypothetical protein